MRFRARVRELARAHGMKAVLGLVLIAAIFTGVLIPSVPTSLWPICAGLLGGFIVAFIAMPQVTASISPFVGGIRRLGVLGVWFWASLGLLLVSLIAALVAMATTAGSGPFWFRILPRGLPPILSIENFGRGVFVLTLFDFCVFAVVFADMALSITDPERLIRRFERKVIRRAKRKQPLSLGQSVLNLVSVGKEVESGQTKGFIIASLQSIGLTLASVGWTPARRAALTELVTGIGDVVCGGAVMGNGSNALFSIDVLVEVFERVTSEWHMCDLDYNTFVDTVSRITKISVIHDYQGASSRGVAALHHMQRKSFRDALPLGILPDQIGSKLEDVGNTCLVSADCEGALSIAARLLTLYAESEELGTPPSVESHFFLAHFFLLAARIAATCEYSTGAVLELARGRFTQTDKEKAVNHALRIESYWGGCARRLASHCQLR